MLKRIILGLLLFAVYVPQALADKPLRIVALAPHIVENLYAIGAGDLCYCPLEGILFEVLRIASVWM